jgi:hypothetical protein
MRAMTIGVTVSILLNVAAEAQDQRRDSPDRPSSTPPASAGPAPQAPVGHRQPTQRSIPPAVRKEEDAAGKPPDPLGPIRNICKNC